MAERTYLYGYGSGKWGEAGRKTKAQILAVTQFAHVHPEHMRRLFAIADAVQDAGQDFGFGGGAREFAAQDAEFRRRHYVAPTGIWNYDGHWWQRYQWAAPYAPPGNSWHEAMASGRGALAVDCLGSHVVATPLCGAHGLVNGISGEPWHYQPLEIPHARRYQQVWGDLAVWPLPNGAPLPTPGGKKMKLLPLADGVKPRMIDTVVNGQQQFGVTDPAAVSAGARGLLANITVADTTAGGFLQAWASGPPPESSKVNWERAGTVVANEVTVWLGPMGTFQIFTTTAVRVVVDVVGYWVPD